MASQSMSQLIAAASICLSPYEALYKNFHSHPELSNQEVETSATCAAHLSKLGVFKIHTNIGGHGLAGVFKNGPGKTILLRADMDALPVLENTSLSYSSTVTAKGADGLLTPVMHACGHDMVCPQSLEFLFVVWGISRVFGSLGCLEQAVQIVQID